MTWFLPSLREATDQWLVEGIDGCGVCPSTGKRRSLPRLWRYAALSGATQRNPGIRSTGVGRFTLVPPGLDLLNLAVRHEFRTGRRLVNTIHPGGVDSGDFSLFILGAVRQDLLQDLPAPGKCRLRVGIVGAPHQLVHTYDVSGRTLFPSGPPGS